MGDWKKSAIDRRDERHTKSIDETGAYPKPRKGSKRKWCKGKIGTEHKTKCVDGPNSVFKNFLICENCGKKLETYYSFDKKKPDWVT